MKNVVSLSCLLSVLGFCSILHAATAAMMIPVNKDSSLIKQSFCCENPEGENFGNEPIATAGKYGQTSRALFGFDLAVAKGRKILRADLMIQNASIVGVNPAHFSLGYSNQDWDEKSVSWNNQPATQFVTDFSFDDQGNTSIEVSDLIATALANDTQTISFGVDATAAGNAIIPTI